MGRLVIVWLHVLAAVVWAGSVLWASHLLVPALARGERACGELLRRVRPVSWSAFVLLAATGLENLRHVRYDSPWVAGKLVMVLAVLPLAAHRDFAVLPRALRAIETGSAPAAALARLRWLDRLVAAAVAALLWLAVGIARGR